MCGLSRSRLRFGEPPHGRHVTGFGRREECLELHAINVILERGPARKAVGSRKHSLRVGQSEIRWIGVPMEPLDFGDGCINAGEVRIEQFLCLLAELGKARLVRESARGAERKDMTSSFPRLLAAWLDVRVANRKKVRWHYVLFPAGSTTMRGRVSLLLK